MPGSASTPFRMAAGLVLFLAAVLANGAAADGGLRHFENGDLDAAVAAWAPLAERGDRWAMVGLGHVATLREEHAEAVRWYHAAAVRDHAEARILLANAYLEGRGVDRDPALAFAWYHVAVGDGHAGAKKARDLAARWLSPDQQAAARAMVRRWQLEGMPQEP